jgi:3-oxoadipate enol-lactonase
MAEHIDGPLYYERMGRTGPVMAFVHPNPMDQSCWIYQMAHLSTWYRCIAMDIPGYGRSPKAQAGLTMDDMAQACWEAIDAVAPGERAILVGCSVGSALMPYMHHQQPERTAALVLSGTGYNPGREFTKRRIACYQNQGVDYRWGYTFEDLSPAYRATPLAHFFADMFAERNSSCDLQSIIYQFEALARPEAADLHSRIACPTIILTGSEDGSHPRAAALKERIPACEMKILYGAGHACQIEQPWLFDRYMIEFLRKHDLFPGDAPISH